MKRNKNNTILILAGILILATAGVLLYLNNFKLLTTQKPAVTASPVPKIPPREPTFTFTKDGIEPQSIEIQAGEMAVWINNSGQDVQINSDDHPTHLKYPLLNFGIIKNKAGAQLTFNKPGTYTFHNHLKPEQKGIVIVK